MLAPIAFGNQCAHPNDDPPQVSLKSLRAPLQAWTRCTSYIISKLSQGISWSAWGKSCNVGAVSALEIGVGTDPIKSVL